MGGVGRAVETAVTLTDEESRYFLANLRQNLGYAISPIIADTIVGHVEHILAARLSHARAAYVAVLNHWHEVDPDHCGGECFRFGQINAALGLSPDKPAGGES